MHICNFSFDVAQLDAEEAGTDAKVYEKESKYTPVQNERDDDDDDDDNDELIVRIWLQLRTKADCE